MNKEYDLLIIGGGAAGIFCAARLSELKANSSICVLEASPHLLSKVKISGGGRCNVTHSFEEPKEAVQNYPRGAKELLSLFSRFGPKEMRLWLKEHGVETKAEEDGRVFPKSNSSQSIIDCFLQTAENNQVEIKRQWPVLEIEKQNDVFVVKNMKSKEVLHSKKVLLTTGSSPKSHEIAKTLGHSITDLAPSLFSFNIEDYRLDKLPGTSFESVNVKVKLGSKKFESQGPMLITHWGLSGPAVLKLSSLAALELKKIEYKGSLIVDFLPGITEEAFRKKVKLKRNKDTANFLKTDRMSLIPARYWLKVLESADINESTRWGELSKKMENSLLKELKHAEFKTKGKTTYKEEFVTAGGIKRSEINFKTMESKPIPNLYFAGEIIDVDGITGGFNFQACWSEAEAIAQSLSTQPSQK